MRTSPQSRPKCSDNATGLGNAHGEPILWNHNTNVLDDHPPPHFRAYYGVYAGKITIESLDLTEGELPRRALALVLEWASEHQDELRDNWELADQHQPLNAIDPLE